MPSAAAPGPLIARDDEVRRLAGLIGLSDGGDDIGGAVVLGGDAGVGKSRLLAELSSRATQSGWRVLVGHCLDFGDAALPYLPFSEVFGRLAAEAPDRAEALVASDSAVGRLLPARRLLTDSGDRPAATDRAALFDAVQGALSELGRESPVLLVVEDVHWADPSTRELLTFLFSRPFDAPVAVVASYRSDDLHRRHPLRGALAQWSRLPAVTRMSLEPLDAAGTRAVVRSLRPQPLPAGELQRIVDRTEGNPFFVEELLAAEGSADQLPTDLADLLLVRLDELDEQTRRVLRAASVAGRRVSHELLLRGAGVDDATLDRALRAAVDANVLVAAGPDGYEFRHALLAESVYQDLLPGERVRLHAAYATALTTGEAAGTAAELARHARAAHDLRTATVASVRAGHEAMAVGGPDEAARHYELALELLAEPGVSSSLADGSLGVDQIDLVVRTCAATVAAGHLTRALALAQDQLHALSAHAATYDRARLIHAVASTALLTDSGRVDVLALTTEAVRLVPAEPPSALRAQLLTVHARANADRARHEDAARWAAEALHLAHRLDLPDVAADATTTMARLDDWAGDAEASRTALVRTVTEARAAGEVAAELRGLFNLAGLRYEQGQLSDALDTYQQTWDRARETGRPWAPYGSDARAMAAVVAHVSGDWQRTAQIVDVRAESPPGLAEAALAAVDMELAAGRGDTEQVALIQRVRPWWQTDGLIAIISGAAAIELHAQRGDLAAAQAMHDDVVSVVSALWENPTFQARIRLGALLLGHVASAAARTATSDRGELVQRGDELAARTHDVADAGKNGGRRVGPESEAWLARLAAEQARLHWLSGIDPPAEGDLLRLCRQAVDAFERFGHVYETARSQARLAAVLRATGQTADATQLVARARAVATRLGAGPLLVELRTLAGPGAALPSTVGPRRGQPLTAREQEVLALLAQGRSNREIAGRLFISAKTVSVHVSNILAKLGAAGRTEAVSLARGLQLLDDGVAPSDRG